MSAEWLDKLNHVVKIPQSTNKTLEQVITAITAYLRSQQNIVVDRWKLLRRRQAPSENFDDFLVDLYSMAEDAEIDRMNGDDWRATLIIHGLQDAETRELLLGKVPALSLEETVTFCRNRELAERDGKSLKSSSSVNANKGRTRQRSSSRDRDRGKSDPKKNKCRSCNGPWPHDKDKPCPAKGRTCKSCGGEGHFASVCKKKTPGSNPSSATPPTKKNGAVMIAGTIRNNDRPEIAID